ncbi:MAG: phosphoribosylformylglycinamidine synthase subunit PurL [Saprospiraceae bacterium]|nr:phosphoribosylformylglycinamidine synthase subunit PurL [Saprospiraceae bacterium]
MTTTQALPTLETARKLGLLEEEYDRICSILGRRPNFTELSIYSVMWSEHCSYKNSIKHLKTLPREGGRLLVEAGEENAGLVDIGDGWACAFKIESHNHPSAIEPYQGAATGVGGIHRDIFTMGARPIAALNSLRFGNLDLSRTKRLVKGVVKGIGDYGNCLGIPTIGGEVYFHESYNENILVNAMSVGVVKIGETVSAIAEGTGNPVFIVGSATGKDGIHGATFASADLTEDSADDLPSVQVGDPFQEKLLLEASLEAIRTGAIVGMQDMGAAGITCSTSEMSAKGGAGMRINLDKVPTRQAHMEPFEILLSESQERMLIVAEKGKEHLLKDVFDKWDLECVEIGTVTDTGRLTYFTGGEMVADVDAESLVLGGGAPVYERKSKEPEYYHALKDLSTLDLSPPDDLMTVARELMRSPNLVSRRWIYEQYDSMVRTNTVTTNDPADASIVRLKDTNKALATSTDCNAVYVHADPYVGTMIAVAEAARNIVCSGGVPVAITNCLNFGNPYNPEAFWQFANAVRGMGEACRKFQTPVTGGNVSFYNQSTFEDRTEPVYPTPTIGMLGLIDDVRTITTLSFKEPGDKILCIGRETGDINSSEYSRVILDIAESKIPYFDIEEELLLHQGIHTVISQGCIQSAHDVSEGGILAALLEGGMVDELGFEIVADPVIRPDFYLFGEGQGRAVITVKPARLSELENILTEQNIPFIVLGTVTTGSIRVNLEDFGDICDWKSEHLTALENYLEN